MENDYQKTQSDIKKMAATKNKTIQDLSRKKLSSMDIAGAMRDATLLVIAFPNNWEEKLDEAIRCAKYISLIKGYSFEFNLEKIKELMAEKSVKPVQNLDEKPF